MAAPDKLKGTLSAPDAAAAIARGLRQGGIEDVRELPLADGGEGTLDALLTAGGKTRRQERVTGPLGEAVTAEWGILADGTAVVEMARASGLALVRRNDALRASTRGTGEFIAAALRAGARRIIVGVGGSASTDGGLGCLEALGWSLRGADVVVACDVRTCFLDAARLYAPQKGATPAQVELLTRRLGRLADEYRARTGVDVRDLEGSGAAGGLAGGLAAIGARLEPGFGVVARAVSLDAALEGADVVVTAEGKVDPTSFAGKVVGGVLEWAAALGVPHRFVIAGDITAEARDQLSAIGATGLALVDRVWQTGEAYSRAALLMEEAAIEIARSLA